MMIAHVKPIHLRHYSLPHDFFSSVSDEEPVLSITTKVITQSFLRNPSKSQDKSKTHRRNLTQEAIQEVSEFHASVQVRKKKRQVEIKSWFLMKKLTYKKESSPSESFEPLLCTPKKLDRTPFLEIISPKKDLRNASFPDLIALSPNHCLSKHFTQQKNSVTFLTSPVFMKLLFHQ